MERSGPEIGVDTCGYGPPAARDPAALAEDIADGKVSAEAARALYGAG